MNEGTARLTRTTLVILLLSTACLAPLTAAADDFRMPIADAFTITGVGVVLTGRVASGSISRGDWVCVPMQAGRQLGRQVNGLELFRKALETVEAGQDVGVLVADIDFREVEKNADLTAGCAGTEAPSGTAGET